MEQLSLVLLVIGFVFMREKTGKGIYGLVAGGFSFVLGLMFFQEPILAVIFIGLAGVLGVMNLFRREN